MYGIVVEYAASGEQVPPNPLERAACHAALVRQPGYHRRLALVADGWRRVADLFLFATPEAAETALAAETWRSFVAAHPACRNAATALLVSESPYGDRVVVLRSAPGPTGGGQACWRDQFAKVEPEAVLW